MTSMMNNVAFVLVIYGVTASRLQNIQAVTIYRVTHLQQYCSVIEITLL